MNPSRRFRETLAGRLALALTILAAAALPARAQQSDPPGIGVAGAGEVKARPTVVEITASVTGDAELAADAIVKYRDAKRRGVDALDGLKLPGLKVETGGFGVNQGGVDSATAQAMMQGNVVSTAGKQRVTVTEQLKLVLSGLDKLKDEELMDTILKVLDTARDSGLLIGRPAPRNYYEMQNYMDNPGSGQGALVTFRIADPEAVREQAYKAAMDDARKRAERIAGLAGVKLGRIVSVKDTAAPQPGGGGGDGAAKDAELSSPTFKEIPVRVRLAVQFEIAK
jgi:hypothetical protein